VIARPSHAASDESRRSDRPQPEAAPTQNAPRAAAGHRGAREARPEPRRSRPPKRARATHASAGELIPRAERRGQGELSVLQRSISVTAGVTLTTTERSPAHGHARLLLSAVKRLAAMRAPERRRDPRVPDQRLRRRQRVGRRELAALEEDADRLASAATTRPTVAGTAT